MPPAELIRTCEERIAAIGEDAQVLLIVGGRKAFGERIRLFGRQGGPLGYAVRLMDEAGEDGRPRVLAYFPARGILAYLAKRDDGREGR